MSEKVYSSNLATDGFGAQYQRVLQTYIFCKMNNLNFVYNQFNLVEHVPNAKYIDNLEHLINLKSNITNINNQMDVTYIDYGKVMPFFEKNIDLCCQSEHMQFLKKCFWENKNKKCFNNDNLNVAVHIRRENPIDRGSAGERATTPNSYYLNIMNRIRKKYANKKVLFHIYSQGNQTNFKEFKNEDTVLYLDHDLIESFFGMVSADVLVMSPSSFSYAAAMISDGEIYYKPFWHVPKKSWIIHKTT
jgi:hypothetical protein